MWEIPDPVGVVLTTLSYWSSADQNIRLIAPSDLQCRSATLNITRGTEGKTTRYNTGTDVILVITTFLFLKWPMVNCHKLASTEDL